MELHSPVQISPRLLPGVRVGDAWVSIEPEEVRWARPSDAHPPAWRYYIDAPGLEYEAADLRGWGWGGSRQMLATLLNFLSTQVERTRNGNDEEALFPPDVAAWACANSDEIEVTMLDLEAVEP